LKGTASYEKDESDKKSTESCEERSKEDDGLEILLANDNEHISSRQEKSGLLVTSKEFIKANEAEKRAKEIQRKRDRRKAIIEAKEAEKRARQKIQRKWDRPARIKDFLKAEKSHDVPRTPDAGEMDGDSYDQPPPMMGTIHNIEEHCSEVSKSRRDSTAASRGDADVRISSFSSSLKASPRYVTRRAQKEIAAGGVDKPHNVVSTMHYLDEADVDASSLPSPPRKSSRVKDTNGSTMTFQSVQKESPGKRVPTQLSGLDGADMDTSSLPSPSRNSSRLKDTNSLTVTSQSVQKESPGKRVSMKLSGLDGADMDTSSLPSPSRNSSRVEDTNSLTVTSQSFQKESPGKPVPVRLSGLDEADMDTWSLSSPSRKFSRVKDTSGLTMTSRLVQKVSPGKRVPMILSGGAHTIPFGDMAKASGKYAFDDGQRESMIKKSSNKALQEDEASIEPEIFKNDPEKQAFSKSLQKMHAFNKTAPHLFSEIAPIDTQSPMRSKLHQGAQNSPRSTMDVLSPSTPEQFNGEKDPSRLNSLPKQAVPINMAIQSKQKWDNILQDLRHLTQTVSQTGISKAVPTRGPYRPDVPPPLSLPPITPARNDALPLAGFSEWEDETFDFSHVQINAFAYTKQAQASAAPAIKPQTPKTNEFSSTKQIQAAAAPASKPMAPTINASPASATKQLAASTGAGGWEDFENLFANDFKTAFANAHPKVKVLPQISTSTLYTQVFT
jgi:hypothetical protein